MEPAVLHTAVKACLEYLFYTATTDDIGVTWDLTPGRMTGHLTTLHDRQRATA